MLLPLDQLGFCVKVDDYLEPNGQRSSFCGFCYAPPVDSIVQAAVGGHYASWENHEFRLPASTLKWADAFPTTPIAALQEKNADGSWKWLTQTHNWAHAGDVPLLRPVSRHTYTGHLWSTAIQKVLILAATSNGSMPYALTGLPGGGLPMEYDPATKTYAEIPLWPESAWYDVYCEDPVSGHVLILRNTGLRVFDPRQRKIIADSRAPGAISPYIAGGDNLVYFPPLDCFFHLGNASLAPYGPPAIGFRFNRTTLKAEWFGGKPTPMITNFRPRPSTGGQGTGFAYDPEQKMIVGGMTRGFMFAFKPQDETRGTWYQHSSAPIITEHASYCHDYVPTLKAHVFVALGGGAFREKPTVAFRWDQANGTVADGWGPTATITTSAGVKRTLQEAVNAGGDITISDGLLPDAFANATVGKACNIIGSGKTALRSFGAGDKGIIIQNADLGLADLEAWGARGPSANSAAVRLQAGNLKLLRTKIHDCQDGILCGGGTALAADVDIDDCDFWSCGAGDGQSHNVYVHNMRRVSMRNSRSWGAKVGHDFKSKATLTELSECLLGSRDFTGTESYNADFEMGGAVVMEDCDLRQGQGNANAYSLAINFGNKTEIHWHAVDSLVVRRGRYETRKNSQYNTFLRNNFANITAYVEDYEFVGNLSPQYLFRGNVLSRRCTLNGKPLPDTWIESPPEDPAVIAELQAQLAAAQSTNQQQAVQLAELQKTLAALAAQRDAQAQRADLAEAKAKAFKDALSAL